MSHGTVEHERIRLTIEQFERDQVLIRECRDEWLSKKGDVWVGVYGGEIVAEAANEEDYGSQIRSMSDHIRMNVETVKLGAPKTLK